MSGKDNDLWQNNNVCAILICKMVVYVVCLYAKYQKVCSSAEKSNIN